MRGFARFFVMLSLACAAVPTAGAAQDLQFSVQRLSDRVLVFKELSPWESNHVVIVSAQGLVLVDPGHSALMGRLIREAVSRELGRDRFAYVIDTHGHWGHTWGNSAFPEAVVIGHEEATREIEADAPNLERRIEVIRGQLETVDARLAELDPTTEKAGGARLQRDHLERILHGLGETGFVVQPPQLTFSDRLDLDLGDLTLEMTFLGRGHSGSDIAILIPEDKILLMGCFFLERGPLPYFGSQPVLDPDRWLEVLGGLLEDETTVRQVVLGQHSVWPRERLLAVRDYIARLWSDVHALDAEGVDFDTAVERLPPAENLDFLRQAGADEEQLAQFQGFEVRALLRQLKTSAALEVEKAIRSGDREAGVARHRELSERNDPEIYFDEAEFNLLGYRLLGEGHIDAAIAVFQLNVDRFPDSWNVYDSLGEAWAAKGDTEKAIELYRRSIELNPNNDNGVRAIEQLRARADSAPTSG